MPARVVDLRNTDDLRDVVHQAVEALAAGRIVALPTETVYGIAASALNPSAVQRLIKIKGRPANKPFAFALKSFDDALDYVPDISELGRRLARRSWPGPVTLVLDNKHPDSVINRLPDAVQQAAVPNGTVGLRVPAHETTLQILRLLAGPILLTSANFSDQEDLVDGQQVQELLGEEIDLIIDDGRSHYGQPSSVVRVNDDSYEILRQGAVDDSRLKQMTGFMALVVCTGNTCRSPMGEALLKKHFARVLGCEIDELKEKGVVVMSAGIAAMPGGAPALQSVEVMQKHGLDISDHNSQPVTDRLANFADVILTLSSSHSRAITSYWPSTASRVFPVCLDGGDIADPIGMPVSVYEKCAEQIETNLSGWAEKLEPSLKKLTK